MERCLRVIRVRGFSLHHMQAEQRPGLMELRLQVSGCHTAEQLIAQLEKLEDVVAIDAGDVACGSGLAVS
jgi:acetolactate synthase regulatory subunit